MERRLAAILAADVVGYSRLMEQDEAGTFARVRMRQKEVFEPKIAQHKGRIFKLMGDGLLAEFGSAVDAVECAMDLQRGMVACNAGVPDDQRIDCRIGVNLGEVIIEDGDCYGDGVNIAARLETLAEPGGLCVAEIVVKQVENKTDLRFQSMGKHVVKNIAEPVSAYRALPGAGAAKPLRRSSSVRWPRRRLAIAITAAIPLIAVGGAATWYFYPGKQWPSGPPVVAVLPFANLTGDPAQSAFSDGVTNFVTTVLSTYPEIRVVAHTPSEGFKGSDPDIRQVAKTLGARYLIEGSVQRGENGAHFTAQLIEGATGEHVWARPIDVASTDPVALQESAAYAIYGALAGFNGEFRKKEEELVWSKPESALDEYDYYLRGHQIFFKFTKSDMAMARQIWKTGLKKFPNSALLRIKIAVSHNQDVVWGWSENPDADIAEGWRLMQEAQAIPNKSRLAEWYSHYIMAFYQQWHARDFDRSVAEARMAIEIAPYDAFTLADLSLVLGSSGNTEEAIEWGQKALRIDPHPYDFAIANMGFSYYLAGRYQEALHFMQRLNDPTNLFLAVVYVRLDRLAEARAIMSAYVKAVPTDSVAVQALWPFKDQAVRERYLEDLRTAGMPAG
jgi:class 3 adenylate cyclase/TolB-like protein